MRKYTCLLLLAVTPLHAEESESPVINVEATRLSDVSGEELKSADLAEALAKKVPEAALVRRSGIANDIILRGQKRDNINILIDGAKVYGACPNRMDPPTSHILTNNIEGIDVSEGPYDVENFGTLSGVVKITTNKPAKELAGEVGVNVGSWNYQKAYASMSAGTDSMRFLLSASRESSDQYEDGDGNTFYDQIINLNPPAMPGMDPRYKPEYKDQQAYVKQTAMAKLFVDVADNQELRFGYTANRSDDVLYPSSMMDALYDDSDIFTAEYSIRDLGAYSSALDFEYYNSKVDHPMSTYYRISSGADSANSVTAALTTAAQGFKVKNRMALDTNTDLTVGVDTSLRNWDGAYEAIGTSAMMYDGVISVDDVDTQNQALFLELDKRMNAWNVKGGLRYDDTTIKPAGNLGQPDNSYSGVGGFVYTSYNSNPSTRYFGGVGVSSRVPDARELYITYATMMGPMEIGTPDLEQTTNTEIDLGVEKKYQSANLKAKLFHSSLKNYIYYNADNTMHRFENIDAVIYGASLTGAWFVTDQITVDYGLAWQRGEKSEALAGQTDKDLADITPAKLNLALNYDYSANSSARLEYIAAEKWSNYDADNGEQAIDAWQVINLKVEQKVGKNVQLTFGVDNLLDETYAVSNTYKDLSLLADGSGTVMLMNEPGRYYYLNAAYQF